MMKNVFTCPHCQSVLNPSVKILLVISYRKKKGMILLSPQPGNYKFICDPSVEKNLKDGAKVRFSCPVCTEDLTSPANNQLAELQMQATTQEPRRVQFSRIYGKQATFVYDGEDVTAFGEDADNVEPTNFFGA
jgi:transcription elongation factor Elf1